MRAHGEALLHLGRVGDQRDLHLVHDGRVVGEELGVEDLAVMAQAQALGEAALGDARPDDVALAHVPDAFGAVDQVVDLPFEDRLEIGLHLPARHLDPDGQRQRGARLRRVSMSGPMISISPSLICVHVDAW